MSKKILAVIMSLVMVISLLPTATLAAADSLVATRDENSISWYSEAISYVGREGLMTGTDQGFEPDAHTTRATIWTILARMDGVDTTVNVGDWYAIARQWSINFGVSDGSDPDGEITREQLATMLYRYAQLKGADVSVGEDTNILSYPDAPTISDFAFAAMQWACGAGIIGGTGEGLNPKGTATRAEVAVMLYRLCTRTNLLKKTITVEFDYNCDGMGVYATAFVTEGEAVEQPDAPTRTGYTFAGWYTAPTGGVRYDFSTPVTAALTLYARWNAVSTGSSGSLIPHRHSFDRVLETVAATCTEDGYTLYGCRCGATYTEEIAALEHDFQLVTDWETLTTTRKCAREGCGAVDEDTSEVPENTYYISSADDLIAFANKTNADKTAFDGKTIKLSADIDMTDKNYATAQVSNVASFTFDGQEYTISGLTKPLLNLYGVNKADVKNVTIKNSAITGNKYYSAEEGKDEDCLGTAALVEVAQWCNLYMEYCHVMNTIVTGDDTRAAALVGYLVGGGEIKNCSVTDCEITAKGSVAAIVGHEQRQTETGYVDSLSITNCTATNNKLTAIDTDWRVGTIIGTVAGKNTSISGCTSTDNTLVQEGETNPDHELYGRISGGELTIDGKKVSTPVKTTASALTTTLKTGFTPGSDGASFTINITDDYEVTGDWTPLTFETTGATIPKYPTVIINGNGHTISGLNAPLLRYNAAINITINDLTLKDVNITGNTSEITNGTGLGAFLSYTDGNITMKNCHLIDSKITAKNYNDSKDWEPNAAGLVGYIGSGGTGSSFTNCSVENCTITSEAGAAGIVCVTYATTSISNCEVKGTTKITSSENRGGTDAAKAGYVIGTIFASVEWSNVKVADTVTLTNTNALEPLANGYIGRFGYGGSLKIDGEDYVPST